MTTTEDAPRPKLTVICPQGEPGTGYWSYRNDSTGEWARSLEIEPLEGSVCIGTYPLSVDIETTDRYDCALVIDDDSAEVLELLDRSLTPEWKRVNVHVTEDGDVSEFKPQSLFRLKVEWPNTNIAPRYYGSPMHPAACRFSLNASHWTRNPDAALLFPTVAMARSLVEKLKDPELDYGTDVRLTVEHVQAPTWD